VKSRRLILALAAAFVVAPPAHASVGATIVARDVLLTGARSLAAAQATPRFTLVGLHWQGTGSVDFRTRTLAGRWSGWSAAAPEDEDRPDVGARERTRAGWRIGNPYWTGASDRIEYRRHGTVRRLRTWFVWSPASLVPTRSPAIAATPPLVSRSGWNADETIRRSQPSFAPAIRFAVVHHTAGANKYTRAESAAIVRGIELYHVKGNGWNDIGYNFLVDRFGQVFEGRYGGIERNVVGAHAEGFNTGSVGIALIGEYTGADATPEAQAALEKLIAWRLDVAHVDPLSTLSAISGGNARFAAGLPTFMRAVSGHRDTGFTACPGDALYRQLDTIAANAARIGLPKVYGPALTGSLGGPVRFRARLSGTLPWVVTVADPLGSPVATGSGTGSGVDWTWDASLAVGTSYTWSISAGAGSRSATGTLGATGPAAPMRVSNVAADPETISPNADEVADATTVTYTLSADAQVTINALDVLGNKVAQLVRVRQGVGEHAYRFSALDLPDAVYQVQVVARGTDGKEASAAVQVTVTRTLGDLDAAPPAFSPNGDGRGDRIAFSFALESPAKIKVRILRQGKWVATPFEGALPIGINQVGWNGAKRLGRLLDGSYDVQVQAIDQIGVSIMQLPFLADTRAPQLRIVSLAPLRVWVSEPATLTVVADGRSVRQEVPETGETLIDEVVSAKRARIVAWDVAGNASKPARRP